MSKLRILGFRVVLLSLLLWAATGAAEVSSPGPWIFFSDLDSGPNSGGESVSGFTGAYVTLYGNFFGASQGSSTVTWNGQDCLRVVDPTSSYNGWGSSYLWYQKIVVQLGSNCSPGPGDFVVTVNGQASNQLPFTVRPGNIYCVSTNGDDGNTGNFPSSCWATIPHAADTMVAGDVTYVEDGVTQTTIHKFTAYLAINTAGTPGNPISLVTSPGATATIGLESGGPDTYAAIRTPNVSGPCDNQAPACYWNIAGFTVRNNNIGIEVSSGSSFFRVVANDVSCPTARGFFQGGCMDSGLGVSNVSYIGNYDHDNAMVDAGDGSATKGFHNMYFSTDSNHIVAAWNLIDGDTGQNKCNGGACNACRGIQFHSTPQGSAQGFDLYDLHVHDNLIRNIHCDAINFATVDPSQGTVEAYNNLIYQVGTGTLTGDTSHYNCINFPGYYYQGPKPSGTAQVYNNTCYDYGSAGGDTAGGLQFVQDGSLNVDFTNNILCSLSGESYISGSSTTSAISGSNNLFFGNGSGPSYLSANVNSDPNFVSAASGDFRLLPGSPAIAAGVAVASVSTDQRGVARPLASAYDLGALEFVTDGAPPPPPTLQSINVTPNPGSVGMGNTVSFNATGHYSDNSTQNITTRVTWSSGDASVATVVSNSGVASGVAPGTATVTASASGLSGAAPLRVNSAPSLTVVDFDTPTPPGNPYNSIEGVFGGINFGSNQWAWENGYLSDPTNNIYFNSPGNTSTFAFAEGTHVLVSMKVATSVAGTLTLSDDAGQIKRKTSRRDRCNL
jgi:hypothetical protein